MPEKRVYDIILADDHALVRAGIRALLNRFDHINVVGEVGNGHDLIEMVNESPPDIVMVDLSMPGLNGLETIVRLRKSHEHLPILVLSMHTADDYVRKAFELGASGFLVKGGNPVELELAIDSLLQGSAYLSPAISRSLVTGTLSEHNEPDLPFRELTSRQREILQMVAEGTTNKEVAKALNISVKTVETHRMEIMNRLNIHDVPGLVRYAIRHKLISLDE